MKKSKRVRLVTLTRPGDDESGVVVVVQSEGPHKLGEEDPVAAAVPDPWFLVTIDCR